MLMHFLRLFFVLLVLAVAMIYIANAAPGSQEFIGRFGPWILLGAVGLALVVIAVDLRISRKSLTAMSGLFFGLLVGLVIAYGLSLILELFAEAVVRGVDPTTLQTIKFLLGLICCYFAVSFVLQTKDDIRFVIPYVEFAKQTKGARPLLLDTSVIIDGRIADICDTRIFDTELVVPRFILQELQQIADSPDKLKRNRGRRGLDMLNKLQATAHVDIKVLDVRMGHEEGENVDQKLLSLARKMDGRVVTNDYNLNKIAQLRGVEVININDLANALKPVFLPGETMSVKIIKPGEEPGQGVGYLEDGTMVVAEGGRDKLGEVVVIIVTSVLQTSAGRMIFGRLEGSPPSERQRRPKARTAH